MLLIHHSWLSWWTLGLQKLFCVTFITSTFFVWAQTALCYIFSECIFVWPWEAFDSSTYSSFMTKLPSNWAHFNPSPSKLFDWTTLLISLPMSETCEGVLQRLKALVSQSSTETSRRKRLRSCTKFVNSLVNNTNIKQLDAKTYKTIHTEISGLAGTVTNRTELPLSKGNTAERCLGESLVLLSSKLRDHVVPVYY
jgi:hypothetical protein